MYHPSICEKRIAKIQKKLPFKLKRYDLEESIERQEFIQKLWNPDKQELVRELKSWEAEFVSNERILSQLDFNYWAKRYAFLNTKDGRISRLNYWESQKIALKHIAQGEVKAWKYKTDNLWEWLKARQLGATQVCETMIGHRLFFYHNQRAVIASDDPRHSLELSRRVEFLYKMLPWYMNPVMTDKVKGEEMFFSKMNSSLIIGHGGMEGGGLGQGQTTNIFHLTEIPDWKNWQMIDEDFLPTVPLLPTSVGFAESTARGRDDHWHDMFTLAWEGKSRWNALFIPWYAERETYRARPPEDWRPDKLTIEHAKKVERQSPMYCFGSTIRLTKEQMYWWEKTYREYKARGRLHIFFQEYASDHLEAFQSANVGLFNNEALSNMRNMALDFKIYEVLSG